MENARLLLENVLDQEIWRKCWQTLNSLFIESYSLFRFSD